SLVTQGAYVQASAATLLTTVQQIDPAPYRATLDSALGMLQKAQANLAAMNAQAERYKILLGGNGVSKQEYDNAIAAQGQAAADVASSTAAVQTARINLGYTDVVSPITGRTGPSLVTQGAYVQASAATLLTTVQQIDPIYADLTQTSVAGLQLRRDVASGRLKVNGPDQAKVTLTLEDGSRYAATGTLQFTDITVDPGTGSVTVRAVFPNPGHVLLPGMFVRASIEQGVTHDPSGHATALVVGPDNKVELRAIQATRTSGANWVVDGGLKDGERVIVSGVQKVQPGTLVRTVDASAPKPLARTN
ncbi:MAG TPA: efflux RND transporter periplasmic adaptor subunit, partial [Steroidobacteraceae bacterium]|nr:efflux RND transporter periplasmic adaptor subunit [Steroidobacteraceae bacterium]